MGYRPITDVEVGPPLVEGSCDIAQRVESMGMEQREALEARFSRDAIAERFLRLFPVCPERSFRARLLQTRIREKIKKAVHFGAFWCIWGAVVSWVRNACEARLELIPLYCTSPCNIRKNSKSGAFWCILVHGLGAS